MDYDSLAEYNRIKEDLYGTADAYFLSKELNITTKAELLAVVYEYVPLTLLGQR